MRDVDICVLLAARSAGIAYFNRHPAEMLSDNLRLCCSLFDAAREAGIRRMVYVSSSVVFDRLARYPITEELIDLVPAPAPGYPFSKLSGEAMCRAYYAQHALEYTIIRPFNVYGAGELPGEFPGEGHVIPELTQRILDGGAILPILGSGAQRRTFTHVSDLARGLSLSVDSSNSANEEINLAGDEEVTVLELARKLWRLCNRAGQPRIQHLPACGNDAERRTVTTSKAANLLNWRPKMSLDEGLREVAQWMRERRSCEHG
jgi:nucleoside-diphosphate-sugar epimerase